MPAQKPRPVTEPVSDPVGDKAGTRPATRRPKNPAYLPPPPHYTFAPAVMPVHSGVATQPGTAAAPRRLSGITLLVVEDSRYACEALRLYCRMAGARMRRAATLAEARLHLTTYRPTVALIDLGLPDGDGCDLLRQLAAERPRLPAIIAMSGQDHLADKALSAGADLFLEKPLISLSRLEDPILALLGDWPPRTPVALREDGTERHGGAAAFTAPSHCPDPLALRDDLTRFLSLLPASACAADPALLGYLDGLLVGIARMSHDPRLHDASHLARRLADPAHPPEAREQALGLLRGAIRNSLAESAVL